METFWQDVRYSLRTLRNRTGFASAVVITLALGIGANATIFTWIKAVFLEPLPGVARPDELVEVWGATRHNSALSLSLLDYQDLRDRNETLSGLAAHQVLAMNLGRGGQPERVRGAVVSGNYFDVLGVKAAIGRAFLPNEDRTPRSHPVVVLGHGLWQRRFGADPQVVGQTITLNEHEFTVIGVAPKEFGSPFAGAVIDVFTPVMMKDYVARPHFSLTERSSRWLMVMGRLKPEVTVEQAQANIGSIGRDLERAYPQTNDQMGVAVFSLTASPFSLKRSLQSAMAILMGAVGVVLLIACANVANLLLGRAAARRKEIAIRLALGGSRQRLVRQMLTESLVLASLGAALGLTVAFWTAGALPAFLPPSGFEVTFDTRPDTVVVVFTLALTVATTILCGLAPTLHASKPDLVMTLKEGTTRLDGRVRKLSLRDVLVIAQVALSMVALVGAGLVVRSLRGAYQANPGFDPDRVLLASFDPFLSGYDEARGHELYRQLVERVRAMPGVESATLARRLPLTLSGIAFANVAIDGHAPAAGEDTRFNYETIGPHYFKTMRIPLAQGRDVDDRDHQGAQRVVVINTTMSQRFWPGGDALGKRLKVGADWLTIVGVANDVKNRSLSERPQPFFYLPLLQDYRSNMILVARTAGDPQRMVPALRSEVTALDAKIPVFEPTTLAEHVGVSLYRQRMAATLLSTFGLLALSLAAVGLYGVTAYMVSQRTRELGVRVAIGATQIDVLTLILRQALFLAAIGIVAGSIVALMVTRFMVNLLFGVGPADPVTFTVIPTVLIAVTVAAAFIPARRAMKLDPLMALRSE